jgi:hypothetical protein
LSSSTALTSEFQNSPLSTLSIQTASWGAPSSGVMNDDSEEDWIRPALMLQCSRQSPMISQVVANEFCNEPDPEPHATTSCRAVMDLSTLKMILRSLLTKRTSPVIEDCVSLMYRFSLASSKDKASNLHLKVPVREVLRSKFGDGTVDLVRPQSRHTNSRPSFGPKVQW